MTRSFHPVHALVAGLLILSTGCVSKSDHQAVQDELATCVEESAQMASQIATWESRYDRETARWNAIEQSVSAAVPQALTELHQERTRILEMVPTQVQDEVSGYLDEYFNTVMAGFDRMARDNEDMRIEILATKKALEALGQDTQSIGRAIDESLGDEKARREQAARDLSDIIEGIVEFDQTKVNCRGCPDRLSLRNKSREAILAFHQELMQDLAAVQTAASAPTATSPDGTDDASDAESNAEKDGEAEPADSSAS